LLSEHTFVATSGEALDAAGSVIAGVVIAAIAKYAAASSRNGVLFVEPPDFCLNKLSLRRQNRLSSFQRFWSARLTDFPHGTPHGQSHAEEMLSRKFLTIYITTTGL
jgi:hypothetical protein